VAEGRMDNKEALPLPDTPLDIYPRAVIVGASSGIGAALAWQLALQGYALALLARREDALQTLCDKINQEIGGRIAFAYPHDVSKYESIPALFQTLLRDLKQIDLVVYCAGIMPWVDISEFNLDKDQQMVGVNLVGGMAWLGQAGTLFERMGNGQIVGISSVAGDRGRVKNPGYSASKAGLDAYLESLRNRLTRKGVHVLTVRPGVVDTPMTEGIGGLFMVPPEVVARDILKAIRRRRQILYTPARWGMIMFIVRNIPSFIFRRLSF